MEGRNIIEAAQRLKDASPDEIQTIARHDWDMIREVAAAAFAYTPRQEPDTVSSDAIPKE